MGLDIVALANIETLKNGTYDNDEEVFTDSNGNEIECFQLPLNEYFPVQMEGLPKFITYPQSWDISFRAGSYGSYGEWRNTLAKIAQYKESEKGRFDITAWQSGHGPFYELINFSDCEGCINSEVSKKLLQDFIDYDEIAVLEGEYFYNKYKYWKEAFEIASQNGVVIFM